MILKMKELKNMLDYYQDDYGFLSDPRYFPVTPEEYRKLTSDGSDVDLSGYYTSGLTDQLLALKQNLISDLDVIRSGASLGATALQSVPSEYVTDTELSTALSSKQDALTAGDNIEIDSAGTISVTGIVNDSVVGYDITYSSNKILDLFNNFNQSFIIEVTENGFYVVDSNNNIGFYVDEQGYHGVNATPSGDVIELFNTTF
jgi:hypothetical protein